MRHGLCALKIVVKKRCIHNEQFLISWKYKNQVQTIIAPYKKAIENQRCCISYWDFVEHPCILCWMFFQQTQYKKNFKNVVL